jgi:hypothetical protein
MKAAAALVACFLVGCHSPVTRSQTCDRAAAVVLWCWFAKCEIKKEAPPPPERETECKK